MVSKEILFFAPRYEVVFTHLDIMSRLNLFYVTPYKSPLTVDWTYWRTSLHKMKQPSQQSDKLLNLRHRNFCNRNYIQII